MLKVIFYTPTILLQLIKSWLPRPLFIRLYKPSTQLERNLESTVRNKVRLADYHARKMMRGRSE